MKVLHLLTSGETGGIESLCRDIGKYGRLDHIFCFVSRGGCIYDKMSADGINVVNLSGNGKGFNIKKLRMLINYCVDSDVIIVHHGDPILKLYYIFAKKITHKHGVTMVHSCYDDMSQIDYHGIKLKIMDMIFQKCFDVSDEVWFVSKAGRKSCERRYKISNNKCKVIYNGISPQLLKKAEKNTIESKPIYNIVYIGRLAPEKGIGLLLDAFAKVKKKYNVKLSIVGDGVQIGELKNQAQNLNINNDIIFYGQKTDVSQYLSEADIFVYPSTCQEVFGIALVEAMAYGIPCIANNVGGIPEVIDDKINGFLTTENSSDEIERLIELIIEKYNDGTIMSIYMNAKEKAQKFSICDTCENIENNLVKL